MKITYLNPAKNDWFLVSWTLSNKCNYRCSYCPANLHNGTTGHPDWNMVKNFVENFDVPGKEICYRLSGGEPTYWKHFIDLAKAVKSKGHTFSFLTNGSQSVEYFEKISPYTDGMIISYHPEYADVDHLINIAKVMKCGVLINLMMIPDKFDELVKIAEVLYNGSDNIGVWPKVILDKTSNINDISNKITEYSADQTEVIKKWPYFKTLDDQKLHRGDILLNDNKITANDIILNDVNNYKGWTCWGGLHMINIDMWGKMYRSDCQQGGPIGDLATYQLPTEPIVCNARKCPCLSDIYLRKELL